MTRRDQHSGTLRRLRGNRDGSALIEFTIMAPFLLSLVLGMAEFGRFLYQYQMVLEGLRDAGRYLARLDPNVGANQANAANLATTGTIDGTGEPRVDGWEAGDIAFSITDIDNTAGTYRGAAEIEVVEVTTTFDYADVGFLSALGFEPVSIAAAHEQRVILE
jgi:Flp pilus assembly protein TadG